MCDFSFNILHQNSCFTLFDGNSNPRFLSRVTLFIGVVYIFPFILLFFIGYPPVIDVLDNQSGGKESKGQS